MICTLQIKVRKDLKHLIINISAVSYTHLDVYKRQGGHRANLDTDDGLRWWSETFANNDNCGLRPNTPG